MQSGMKAGIPRSYQESQFFEALPLVPWRCWGFDNCMDSRAYDIPQFRRGFRLSDRCVPAP